MRNPCMTCDLLDADKLYEPRCRDCERREAYVRAIGGMCASMPDGMTNMCGVGHGHGGLRTLTERCVRVKTAMEFVEKECARAGFTAGRVLDVKNRNPRCVAIRLRIAQALSESPWRLDYLRIAATMGCKASTVASWLSTMRAAKAAIAEDAPVEPAPAPPPRTVAAADVLDHLGDAELADFVRHVAVAHQTGPIEALRWIVGEYRELEAAGA